MPRPAAGRVGHHLQRLLPGGGLHAVQIAGHELQFRVGEGRAAAVGQCDPPIEIGGLVVAADREHVVRLPRQAASKVRRLDAVARASPVQELPDERGPAVEIGGEFGKTDVVRVEARDVLVADLPDRAVVVADEPGFHLFLLRRAVLGAQPDEHHLAADVLAEELLRLEQVVLVVLLEDAHARGVRERAEMHRGRIHGGRDVDEVQVGLARRERELADVANEGETRVVDRDRQVRLVVTDDRLLGAASRGGGDPGANGQTRNGDGEDGGGHNVSSCVHLNLPGSVLRTETYQSLAVPPAPWCGRSFGAAEPGPAACATPKRGQVPVEISKSLIT